jgi:hypothetical protein
MDSSIPITEVMEKEEKLLDHLKQISLILNLDFASTDIVLTPRDGRSLFLPRVSPFRLMHDATH